MRAYPRVLLILLLFLSYGSYASSKDIPKQEHEISPGMETGKVYVGEPIDLYVQDAEIHAVLRLLSEACNIDIVVSGKVKGKMTMRLKSVPCDQALDLIISHYGLGYVQDRNGRKIVPYR